MVLNSQQLSRSKIFRGTHGFPRKTLRNAFPQLSRKRCVFRENDTGPKLLGLKKWIGKNFQNRNFPIFHFPTFPLWKKCVWSKNSSNKSCSVLDYQQLSKIEIFRGTHWFPGKPLRNAFPRLSLKLLVFWENFKRTKLLGMKN